jgi:hypothetical protein
MTIELRSVVVIASHCGARAAFSSGDECKIRVTSFDFFRATWSEIARRRHKSALVGMALGRSGAILKIPDLGDRADVPTRRHV